MTRYVALLKGINVGGNKQVPMADLRSLLADLGCTDVRTVLQSGNAIVTATGTAAALQRRVEAAIAAEMGLRVRCLVRTGPELKRVIAGNPLAEVATNGSRLMALFLSAAPDAALAAEHDPTTLKRDSIRIGDRVIYQWCPDGVSAAPPVSAFVERHWQVAVTGRNWNTVRKLAAFLDG